MSSRKKLGWFRNVNFRRAVACAINRDDIVENVLNGFGFPHMSAVCGIDGVVRNNIEAYLYNIEKSKLLLAKEGLNDNDGNGVLKDKNGNAVEFSLAVNGDNIVRWKIAEKIKEHLGAVGIKVLLQRINFNSLTKNILSPPFGWEAALLGFSIDDDLLRLYSLWHSSGAMHVWFPKQKIPSTAWETDIDSLLIKGIHELDVSVQDDIKKAFLRIISVKLPLIPTVLPERLLCISNRFKNINPSLKGGLLHNIEEIFCTDRYPQSTQNIVN